MSIQYHTIYVAACAVRPEQVQHAEWTSPQSSESTTDNSDEESLDPHDNAYAIPTTSTQFKHLKGSAHDQCMSSAQWIDEFKAAGERHKKRKTALAENAALERMKAIMKSGGHKGAQCCTPSLPNAHGVYLLYVSIQQLVGQSDSLICHHCKPITLITFVMSLAFLNRGAGCVPHSVPHY